MTAPVVTVIVPVFNAEAYVGASLESILRQTFSDLQVIVVNDGSTDRTQEVLDRYTDARLTVVQQPNGGVSAALNTALSLAKAPLIARQDADDISEPERIAEQLAYFKDHPDTVILGTWGRYISPADGPDSHLERPVSDAAIRFAMLFDTPFVSTSVMFRADALERTGAFDTSGTVWDDYDMWSRLVMVGKAANLPKRLVRYRVVGTSISRTSSNGAARVMEQRRRNHAQFLPGLPAELLPLACRLGIDHPETSITRLKELGTHYNGFIHRITDDPGERALLHRQLIGMLRSARVVPHRTVLHRLCDKLIKWTMLH